jgi:transposase
MEIPQLFPLGNGLELTQMEMGDGHLRLHVTPTSRISTCPLCEQSATRMHSRYSRLVKDLPCAGQQVQLILHVAPRFFATPLTACERSLQNGFPNSWLRGHR